MSGGLIRKADNYRCIATWRCPPRSRL